MKKSEFVRLARVAVATSAGITPPMRLSLVVVLLLVVRSTTLWASSRSWEAAKSIAGKFFLERSGARVSLDGIFVASDDDGEGCYVFNADAARGWVIVSADASLATPILAFGTEGRLVPDHAAEPMRAMLPNFANASSLLPRDDASALPASRKSPRRSVSAQRPSIAPMINTTWGQTTGGYNLLCPTVSGVTAPAGCVAVAMAKIMYQHQSPTQLPYAIPQKSLKGTGNWSSRTFTFPACPEGTPIDWANILPAYAYTNSANDIIPYQTTTEQQQAIANLLLYCGQAVDMQYGPTGAGASPYDIPEAMAYFGYPSACCLSKKLFNVTETAAGTAYWEDFVHWELSQGRSVIYGGTTTSSDGTDVGHAFVIDGYDAGTGFFHVHWGWFGISNGYFNLSLLNPTGRSGDKRQYTKAQTVIMGLAPRVPLMRVAESKLSGTKLTVKAECLIDNENLQLECGIGYVDDGGLNINYMRTTMPVMTQGATQTYTIDVSKLYTYVAFKGMTTGAEVRLYPMCQANLRRNTTVSNSSTSTQVAQCIGATQMGRACCILKKTSSGFTILPVTPLQGDINGDEQLTIADVTALVNILLGRDSADYDHTVADVNGDGQLTIADVTALVNLILDK